MADKKADALLKTLEERDLRRLVAAGAVKQAIFQATDQGFVLYIHYGSYVAPLVTFRNEVRLFRRGSYALKFAQDMGLTQVLFELMPNGQNHQ